MRTGKARLTSNGREARDMYPQLFGIVEQLWLNRFLTLQRLGLGAGPFVPTFRRRYMADRALRRRICSLTYRNNKLGARAEGHSNAMVRRSGSPFIWGSLFLTNNSPSRRLTCCTQRLHQPEAEHTFRVLEDHGERDCPLAAEAKRLPR
jgi:hypothetical protein